MNRIHTTLAITGLCAVIVGWQVWKSNALDPSAPATDSSSIAAHSTDPASAPNATSDENRQAAEIDPFDFARRLENDPDCYVAAVVTDPVSGEPVDAIACDRESDAAHPYESWSESVLAGMAYADAKAAEVLGLRHIQAEDPNREALGLMLLYRSVALSGDTSAIHRAIGKRYAVVATDGRPEVHNLKQLLVFGIVTTSLGDKGINTQSLESRLAEADIPTTEILQLKADARKILDELVNIERDVTGNTIIAEALKNA